MNKIVIIGNLTQNPEIRYVDTASGQQTVCNFTVAVNRYVRDRKITDYFRVSCWNKQADNAAKFLARGSKVAVTGPVTARAYVNRDNKAAASLEVSAEVIEYLSSRQDTGQAQDGRYGGYDRQPTQEEIDGFMRPPEGYEEELPFH